MKLTKNNLIYSQGYFMFMVNLTQQFNMFRG